MSPIAEHAAMVLVALSDAKNHIRMVNRLVGSNKNLDALIFDLEKMEAEILTIIKAAQGMPVWNRLT